MLHQRTWTVMLVVLLLAGVWGTLPGNGATSAQAGGGDSVFIYNYDTGQWAFVFNAISSVPIQTLPLPPNTSTYPHSISISRDGQYLAACLFDNGNNPSVGIYDLTTNSYLGGYTIPGMIVACRLDRYSFSEDGTQLAFGLLNHFHDPMDARPDWELVVMQVQTSNVAYHLTSQNPLMAGLGLDVAGKLPSVSTFQMASGTYPGLISFKLVPYATEGMCEYESIVWNLGQNQVNLGGRAGKNAVDYLLPNSEAVWVATDSLYPQGVLMGPGCAHNVVMYSNKMGNLHPLFTNGTVLWGSTFIDGGNKVAFSSDVNGNMDWLYVDRNGVVNSLPNTMHTYEVWGTSIGYAFIDDSGSAPSVHFHQFSGGPSPADLVAWTGQPGSYWRILWAEPITAGNGLPPFPPMAVVGPQPPQPPGPAILIVGGQAQVNTTEGDMLRIRSGPGMGYGVSFLTPHNTLVTLLEGPVLSTGYNWWKINVPGRGTGWAIEGLQEPEGWLQTLMPVQ